ncbi:SRPBCC family protein [Cyanobacteria bacterium FACHB-DQ100]|nr:SRPBCC family protein [Cyanobacteria bacterium FACHB-DQ100]
MMTLVRESALMQGEILLKTKPHSAWGGAVTAQMYLPIAPTLVWEQVTDYPRWTQYFPEVTRSEVRQVISQRTKRIYQAASKAFLIFTAQVEITLNVLETHQQRVQFFLESGSFSDFTADLQLQSYAEGTILTYAVQATPTIPVPSFLIEQAIRLDLPVNLRRMRSVICAGR